MATTEIEASHKRVLVFSTHFWPNVGGVERFTQVLFKRLQPLGWTVRVFCCNPGSSPSDEVVDSLQIHRFAAYRLLNNRYPVPTLGSIIRIFQQARRYRPKVIVTNTRFYFLSLIGVIVGKLLRVPVYHIDHGSSHMTTGSSAVFNKIGEAVDHIVGWLVLKGATVAVGVSKAVSDFLAHLGRDNCGVLYNGVDTQFFAGDKAATRAALGLPPDKVVIFFCSRLIEEKGVRTLLDSCQFLGSENYLVIIAGEGELRGLVEERIGERIRYLGVVPREVVRDYLVASDIFVHPSFYPEGLPTALLEAGAAGCAVITTAAGGSAEVVSSSELGIVIEPNSPKILAEAMLSLIRDRGLRDALGSKLRDEVRRRFDWEAIASLADRDLCLLVSRSNQ